MNIHHNLEAIKDLAIESAKEHGCNYSVILVNPDENGKFNVEMGSTYEFVADSYFEKPRPNVILLHKTDDLIKGGSEKRIGVIGVGGGGSNFARTIMMGGAHNLMTVVDSPNTGAEISSSSTSSQFFPRITNIDHDYNPIKIKKGSSFTPKKKKRKK